MIMNSDNHHKNGNKQYWVDHECPWAADFSPARGKSIHHFNWLNYHWWFQTILNIPNIFVPGWVRWVSRIFGQDIMEHVQKIRLLQHSLENAWNIWGVHTQTPIRSAWKESSNINGCAFTSSNSTKGTCRGWYYPTRTVGMNIINK